MCVPGRSFNYDSCTPADSKNDANPWWHGTEARNMLSQENRVDVYQDILFLTSRRHNFTNSVGLILLWCWHILGLSWLGCSIIIKFIFLSQRQFGNLLYTMQVSFCTELKCQYPVFCREHCTGIFLTGLKKSSPTWGGCSTHAGTLTSR